MQQHDIEPAGKLPLKGEEFGTTELLECISNIDSVAYVLEAMFDPEQLNAKNGFFDFNKVHPLIEILSANTDKLRLGVLSLEEGVS